MPNSLSFCPRRGLKQRQEPEQHESANSQVAGQTGRRWIYGAGINSGLPSTLSGLLDFGR